MTAANKQEQYLPFRRAGPLLGSSLYWIPVSAFPCRSAEKEWLARFLFAFDQEMKAALECRVEVFVHRDAIYPDMVEPMLMNVQALNPVPGVIRFHGEPLRKSPKPREIPRMVAEGKQETLLKMGSDVGWWFAKKNAPEQRQLFFGLGGMVNIWLPPDLKTAPPSFPLPEKVLQHPAFVQMDPAGALAITYSFLDSFLPNSIAAFAPELKQDPQYRGYPFAVALLNSGNILGAPGEQREKWLELAPCYMFESQADGGILLWGTPAIDVIVRNLVESFRQQNLEYPLV